MLPFQRANCIYDKQSGITRLVSSWKLSKLEQGRDDIPIEIEIYLETIIFKYNYFKIIRRIDESQFAFFLISSEGKRFLFSFFSPRIVIFKFVQHERGGRRKILIRVLNKLSMSNQDNPNDRQRNDHVFTQEASCYVRVFAK